VGCGLGRIDSSGNVDFGSRRLIGRGIWKAMLIPLFAAALALQDSPAISAPEPPAEAAVTLDALPIEQAAAARCAITFATIGRWQRTSDNRGADYPPMASTGGREFFVRVMAKLTDETGLTRENLTALVVTEVDRNETPEGTARVAQMMPACELMKLSAGL
jgi:uncharacterized protein (DUF2267 family)